MKYNKEKRILRNSANTIIGKNRKYIGNGLIALSFSLALSGCNFYSNKITIAEAVDQEGDEYDGVPILDDDENCIGVVSDGDLIFVYGEIEYAGDLVSVEAITSDGETVTGQVYSEYLEEICDITLSKIKRYSTVYTVTAQSQS